MIGRALPTQSRVSLRETCRPLADALAGAFDAVCVDARLFESGGSAAAAGLARVCPAAQRAVVKLWLVFSKPPSEASLGRLFTTLASTKPLLESLDIEWVQDISVYFQRRLAECRRPSMDGAEALCAAPVARAAAAALACAGCGPRLRRLALMPAALGGTGAGPDAPRDGAISGVALLSRLPRLRQVVAREADPTRGPGVSPAGLSEIGCISGLESLSVDLWTGDVAEDALQFYKGPIPECDAATGQG
ncbi:hypothetical protein MNEG_4243 [Monoraphidium neglectum]|uniref:Uncharacterized protein n=1 Tax=Monoraphidium neglectum TaxID=145388 RepID=A0A0D2MLG6_9CHLO|nr:hypothetical protein MNEG_4243 [Monoraphidium neglectum]KIZ03715.1 hypothetical protein MNEG_4243 [Monoraphidium neglectum]|eukprot:XP_013902734.1 hypothetical protein MNEG_4243 [Monoraphidium neglectum]